MEKHTGFTRIIKASQYSYKGLSHAFKNEAAFKQEAIAAFILIPIALFLPLSSVETLLLIGTVVWVLVVELLNSSIEAVVDRVGLEYHELAGLAKDMGSAAVLISIIFCVFVWLFLLVQLI